MHTLGIHLAAIRFSLALAMVLPLAPAVAAATREGAQAETPEASAAPSLKPRTARIFSRVREALEHEDYDRALEQLDRLSLRKASDYERAYALRLRGYVAYGRGENAAAIEQLLAALAEPGLPPPDRADTLFQIAQIQAAEKRWRDVLGTLERWFETAERPNSVGYFLTALAHYQLGETDAAILPATKAVEIAAKPQQTWLQLLLALHLTQKNYAAATPVLEQMISLYPNSGRDYWLQLSALYAATNEPARSLAALELAHQRGLLSEDRDLRRMLQLMISRGIPLRAAEIFEREIAQGRIAEETESLELLSASWMLAREIPQAEAPLARAAELAPDGELWVRAGQLHMLQEEWSDAAAALRKALDKGGLKQVGNAQLLLGIACYNEQKLQEARGWFAMAQRSDATRDQARTWLEHVDRELGAPREVSRWGG